MVSKLTLFISQLVLMLIISSRVNGSVTQIKTLTFKSTMAQCDSVAAQALMILNTQY